ncbi:cation diffusion facilitator family transporter [Chloroflexota bacterium]
MFSTRKSVTGLALAVVIILVTLKIIVTTLTGSISILAQAADSFLDLFAILITFVAVIVAVRPPDEDHPFGHGKVENIAAVIQALLIFTAGGLIIYSAIRRIISGTVIEMTEAGIGVMLFSMIASVFLSRHLHQVARDTDSLAIEASARNINADIYSAAGVLIGLVVIRFTEFNILDPIIAIIVSLLILKAGYEVSRKAIEGLIDVRLPEVEEETIRLCIMEHYSEVVSFHRLRTRKSGNQRFIYLHLVMPKHASVVEAHSMCDHLEEDLEERLNNTNVTIHIEPCSIECTMCRVTCDLGNIID